MTSPPVWTIGKSKRDGPLKTESNAAPGPGSYEYANLRRIKAPAWRIGNAQRSVNRRSETPGPGSYESTGKTAKNWPKYPFGVKTATSQERIPTPGPGAYDVSNSTVLEGKAPSYSMRLKSGEVIAHTESPGPGAYDQTSSLLFQRHSTYKIGTSKRDALHGTVETPGPGSYFDRKSELLDSKNGPKWGFGTAQRGHLNSTTQSLAGPGSYNLDRTFDGSKGVSILSKRRESAIQDTSKLPGPGSYNPSLTTKTRFPAYRIGSAPRNQLSKDAIQIPGPGNYDPQPPRKSKNIKIGTSTRQSMNERAETPGPGAYSCDLSKSCGPQHIIVPKREDVTQSQKERETPGPGAYDPSVKLVRAQKPKFRIGTASRESPSLDGSPGPGTYGNVSLSGLGPKWSFGTDSRDHSRNQSPEPGPGSYNVPAKFANIPSYVQMGMTGKSNLI